MKLNLGCGKEKLEGYLNCDINPEVKPDKIIDFNQKFPFDDNSFEEVRMSHSLEHTKNLGFTLSECFRVSQGKVKIIVPSPRSPQYFLKFTDCVGDHTSSYQKLFKRYWACSYQPST